MRLLHTARRGVANVLRGLPWLYDLSRQARLQLLGPTSEIGAFLDVYSKTKNEQITFLQIGANDGLRNDPLRDFVVRDSWTGCFVEPLPDVFPLLKRNYRRYSKKLRLEFLNVAVTSHSQSLPFFTFTDQYLAGKPLEERLHLLRKASFKREQVRAFAESDSNIREIGVPCVGIRDLLAQCFPCGRLGLLALDVEGHEPEILREIDFEAFEIDAVLLETWNLGASKNEVVQILERAGYRIDEAEGDALAVKEPNSLR
jgi:FkbM family methyltransferase